MSYVHTNGIETYYEQLGDGQSIVCIHGALMTHTMWEPQVSEFADRYEIITYDVRGHGQTGDSPRQETTVDQYVTDLRALIGELELDQPILCGVSLGGTIALGYASHHSDTIAGVVLADAPLTPNVPDSAVYHRGVLPLIKGATRTLGTDRVMSVTNWIEQRFLVDEDERAVEDDDEYDRLSGLEHMDAAEFNAMMEAQSAWESLDPSAITVPALLLTGDHSPEVYERETAEIANQVSGPVTETTVTDAGHMMNVDAPGEFNAELAEFLDAIIEQEASR